MSEDAPSRKSYMFMERAWYSSLPHHFSPYSEEMMIGLYYDRGGCDFEFSVRFFPDMVKLGVFSDTWEFYDVFKEVLDILAEVAPAMISPDELAAKLEAMGYVDRTSYIRDGLPGVKEIDNTESKV